MSLLKHCTQYLFGKAGPSLIQLVALSIFSRLLSPDSYGQYALIIAGVGLANAVLFQWLRLGLLRFWPIYETRQEVIVSTLLAGFGGLLLISCIIFLGGLAVVDDPALRGLLVFGLILLWAEALFELCQQLERSKMMPLRYGTMGFIKAGASLGIGVVLVQLGYGAVGLLAGTLAGFVLPLIWQVRFLGRLFSLTQVDRVLLTKFFKYGMPLTANFALRFFIRNSDRILLGYFLGAGYVGLYAIGANLAEYSIGMLMMVVNLAAFPLAVDALEKSGRHAANRQLEQNLILLVAIGLPASVGVWVLAPNIAEVLIGESFRGAAVTVIPIITLGAFLSGIKAFYFDLSFHLGQSTIGQVWVSLIATLVNILLNLLFIPKFGLPGAAFATVLAYIVGLFLSIVWGRKIFPLPVPTKTLFKIVVATAGMAVALVPLRSHMGGGALAFQILAGCVIFVILAWKLEILKDFREHQPTKRFCQSVLPNE